MPCVEMTRKTMSFAQDDVVSFGSISVLPRLLVISGFVFQISVLPVSISTALSSASDLRLSPWGVLKRRAINEGGLQEAGGRMLPVCVVLPLHFESE